MKKRILSWLLVAALLLTGIPAAVAADSGFASGKTAQAPNSGPVGLPVDTTEKSGTAADPTADTDVKLVHDASGRFSRLAEEEGYQPEDVVDFIVVMKQAPLLAAGYTADEIAAQTASVTSYQAGQLSALNALKRSLGSSFAGDETFKLGFTYTIAATALSVTAQYGNREKLESMPGVDHVYVAPTFQVPEDYTVNSGADLRPMTSNATRMIGADKLNTMGYTGKGMKVAILDTGIVVDHPSFGALSEDKLTETSLTKDGVNAIWDTLNASKTNLRNLSYYNSKLPFIFNYTTMDYDVSHATAQHDHGTHVAGIVAANRTEGTSVIGVAPDAQLVVMQVFSRGGGASWATIMAGMEDAVRLNVDACNLSLGAAAGFTSGDMAETLKLFRQTDIEILIAAGNETNSAYLNRTGLNMSKAGDPDNGLVGTPSTLEEALSVASVDNDGAEMLYFTANGRQIGYNDTSSTSATRFLSNFSGKTLQFVPVGGYGEPSDYEGLDVTGKVALVSRGSTSFPEKQAAAQEAGAIACVVYNNTLGLLNMQINDGGKNIPCVSISMKDGAYLKEQYAAGQDTLTVCRGDTILVNLDRTMSDFSSWGVTPDLKLKPEITGVGGSILSSRDPSIAGSNYGLMSGTSMATPQVAGAMAILMEYLRKNYPQYQEAELRQVAANLMMSTSVPVITGSGLEYSPRNQGAGLVDLEKATTSSAYLSNPDAVEGRPKGEFGDDDSRNGVYSFPFEIHNMSGSQTLSYRFDSSVLTEQVVSYGEEKFIANAPYKLNAKVEILGRTETDVLKYDFNDDGQITTADARLLLRHINGAETLPENDHAPYRDVNGDGRVNKDDVDVIVAWCAGREVQVDMTATVSVSGATPVTSVQVPAGGSVALTARITLDGADKTYLDGNFKNGMYVEGFLYAVSEDEDGVDLHMPFVGFYGDWSDAPVFDEPDDSASLYPRKIFTNNAEIGVNPYLRTGASGDQYNAFSYANPLAEIDVGLLRNAKKIAFTVTNTETGEVYWELSGNYISKSYYNSSYGMILPFYVLAQEGEVWDGTDAKGEKLPDGTKVTYATTAWLDDGDETADDFFSFDITLDDKAPVIENAYTLQQDLKTQDGKVILPLSILENQHVAALMFINNNGVIMGKYAVENEPGKTFRAEYDITGYGTDFTILVADYACNETELDVSLDLGDMSTVTPAVKKLESDRLYGCETFDGALVEGGWFSARKSDFSDPRNETFDSANRFYSGEYVNGRVIAQRASDGAVVLVTPYNTYWGVTELITQSGKVGDQGFKVLYDMALDYSDKGKLEWDNNANNLYAVGWAYQGDNDGDGKDDGHNALFQLKFYSNGYNSLDEVAEIRGVDGELLTLGCTTDGQLYGISTQSVLYKVERDGQCTPVGTTDFVNVANYSGANVIQSMGYDHNDGTMYWYAHSQTANGGSYLNVCMTYKVNLETGKCTEVGTYGPGGQTALFVPTDRSSDLFELDANPTGFQISPYSLTMAQGQRIRFSINWQPWNAKAVDVTWATEDEKVVTVNKAGFVTAVGEGETTITATATIWNQWDGVWEESTQSASIRVVGSADGIYGYIVEDFKNADNRFSWVTFSDRQPGRVTQIAKQNLEGTDMDGNPVSSPALWQGAAYYNGYGYVVTKESFVKDNVISVGTALYRFAVNKGETPDKTTFGPLERVGFTEGIELGNLGFDYNTGRMYAVDYSNGGLGIIDLDNGAVDLLGTYSGDIGGPAITPAMCVTAEGWILVSDMSGNLYTVDCDTLSTKRLESGSLGQDTWYYASMMYDYNTGNIYWNPCMNSGMSPLCLVRVEKSPWSDNLQATIVDLGDVSTKAGVEMTGMFTIPENEPETKQIPVEGIEITNGDSVTGLVGGTLQLGTRTTPLRPTVQAKTWTSSDESVVTVDRFGKLTYRGVGEATVTVSISNKNPADGGPFRDTISVTVYESAGNLAAFLDYDEASWYSDFWLTVPDYDVQHSTVGVRATNSYSLRTGEYYDGFFYAYTAKGDFYRFDAKDVTKSANLGKVNLDLQNDQVVSMAVDYASGIMYGLTLSTYNTYGKLVTIDMDTGAVTEIAALSEKVYALAIGKDGTLYAAGSPQLGIEAKLYTLDPKTAACTFLTDLPGAHVGTGSNYYGSLQYNPQMTYDYGTNRLYLSATYYGQNLSYCSGIFMIQLGGETPVVSSLGMLSLETMPGRTPKQGNAYLGMLCAIPEADEVPVGKVNGVILNKNVGRVAAGVTTQLTAAVRPSNAANPKVNWSSSDEAIATVDSTGLVTAKAAGTVIITAASDETGVFSTCQLTVVATEGKSFSTAYTVSAKKDALISFTPELPSTTAQVVASFNGGTNIAGLAYGDECLYYLLNTESFPNLYRYDFATKQSTFLGQLYVFTTSSDMAYDPVNHVVYVVAGYYLFQFDLAKLDAASLNYYSAYQDCSSLSSQPEARTVACKDGYAYFLGRGWYDTMLMRVDVDFRNVEVITSNLGVNVTSQVCEMDYDPASDLFYVTDAADRLYTFRPDGTGVTVVDVVGDALDINGLAIRPAAKQEP